MQTQPSLSLIKSTWVEPSVFTQMYSKTDLWELQSESGEKQQPSTSEENSEAKNQSDCPGQGCSDDWLPSPVQRERERESRDSAQIPKVKSQVRPQSSLNCVI